MIWWSLPVMLIWFGLIIFFGLGCLFGFADAVEYAFYPVGRQLLQDALIELAIVTGLLVLFYFAVSNH